MRTTVDFDHDTAKAIEHLRRERGIGLSQAVNDLVRLGLMPRPKVARFKQTTRPLGLKIDISNVEEALDYAEGPNRK